MGNRDLETWNVEVTAVEEIAEYIEALSSRSAEPFIVCIDYFDTIVTRRVAPEHTKKMACEVLSLLLETAITGGELYEHRRKIELEMTTRNSEENGELDFSLAHFALLYLEIIEKIHPGGLCFDREEFVSLILNIEVAVEQAVQEICPQVLRLLELLREKGITLLLVSDFYLPEDFFRKMMRAVGVEHFFDTVYISSTLGSSKGSGRIYGLIAEEYRCPPDRMLMIGDNLHADIRMAGQYGMRTLHMQRPIQQRKYAAFTRLRESGKQVGMTDYLEDLPLPGNFSEMACSLWLFTHRLFQALWHRSETDVFFLSKEGEFLKRLFVRYQQIVFGKEMIRSHYLLASRKATFLASLRRLEDEDFLRLFAHYRDISLSDFLYSLNLEEEDIREIHRNFPDVFVTRKQDLRNSPEFARLLELPLFRHTYESSRRQQRHNFSVYLNSFGVDLRARGISLVDVGWKGSIQDNIFHILEEEIAVTGYYIGIFHATEKLPDNRKTGLLFDNTDTLTPYYGVYNNNRSLFEMLLGATHGSAAHYLLDGQKRRDSDGHHCQEHVGIATGEGRLQVMVLDLPEERRLYRSTIQPLQDNMLRLFERMCHSYLLGDCRPPSAEWFARRHARIVFLPRKEEVDLFAALYHLENFGIFEYTNFQAGDRLTIGERWRNLRRLMRNPSLLETGIWPPIILRRLGLGPLCRLDGLRRHVNTFCLDTKKFAGKESVGVVGSGEGGLK